LELRESRSIKGDVNKNTSPATGERVAVQPKSCDEIL
jgi:hypothetical protein